MPMRERLKGMFPDVGAITKDLNGKFDRLYEMLDRRLGELVTIQGQAVDRLDAMLAELREEHDGEGT